MPDGKSNDKLWMSSGSRTVTNRSRVPNVSTTAGWQRRSGVAPGCGALGNRASETTRPRICMSEMQRQAQARRMTMPDWRPYFVTAR